MTENKEVILSKEYLQKLQDELEYLALWMDFL